METIIRPLAHVFLSLGRRSDPPPFMVAVEKSGGTIICVHGFKQDGAEFTSPAITGRVSSDKVQCADYSMMILHGEHILDKTNKNGFSRKVSECFKTGFPEEWKELCISDEAEGGDHSGTPGSQSHTHDVNIEQHTVAMSNALPPRKRLKPLKHWMGERLLYGCKRKQDSMPEVIGVKIYSPGQDGKKRWKVISFVPEEYSDLVAKSAEY